MVVASQAKEIGDADREKSSKRNKATDVKKKSSNTKSSKTTATKQGSASTNN
ncbi:hypothetical protein BGW38_010550, partial [Lunasporangiospora selenospora]